ncbi:FapA family protein [Clostridium carnis]
MVNINMKNNKEDIDGFCYVRDRNIIVRNPIGKGKFATIIPPEKGNLIINNEVINRVHIVKETDKISFEELVEDGEVDISLKLNNDNTEAYISLSYKNNKVYRLKDSEKSNCKVLEVEEKTEIPSIISEDKIRETLKEQGIIFGLDEEAIKQIKEKMEIRDLLIAKGIKAKEPIEDKVEFYFNDDNKIKIDESLNKIDYKNLKSISSVKAGEILAEIIIGEDGEDGINVFSQKIPKKLKSKLVIKIGAGCKKIDNKIISTIDGKPSFKKGMIYVSPIHIVGMDVNISSGNIDFPANVQINGKVTEGMKVISGGSVEIRNGVFSAFVEGKDTSKICGNIVSSEIKIGGKDLIKETRIDNLTQLKEYLNSLYLNISYLKERNLVDRTVNDGMLIKRLIETKYKNLSKICIQVISSALSDCCQDSKVSENIKKYLIGLAPVNIKNFKEVLKIIDEINLELENLKKERSLPADLTIEYGQDAKIYTSGSINIIGKGVFASEIKSLDKISFYLKNSVCRGGCLKARNEIVARVVGSEAGVKTKLEVGENGRINVDVAYQNTTFCVGNKCYILDRASKDIQIYIDKQGNLAVDKLLL